MSRPDLERLRARASTLWERLAEDAEPVSDPAADNDARVLMERWCQRVAGGRLDLFDRRLAWDGTSGDRVRRCLGQVIPRGEAPRPPWLEFLAAVWERFDEESSGHERFLSRTDPVPFQEVLVPFIIEARVQLAHRAATARARFLDQAHAMLERALLQLLSRVAAATLQHEFELYRQAHRPVTSLFGIEEPVASYALYDGFVQSLRQGGFATLLGKYAMLARLLSTLTHGFVVAQAELMHRFDADAGLLAELLGLPGNARVIAAEPCLSDLHDGARTVTLLHIDSGDAVVYKPRSLALESRFHGLLQSFNAEGSPEPFTVPRMVSRPGYGWIERVTPRPCRNDHESVRCYRRAGALLAVLYLLDCTDAHIENVMLDRDGPVLIDAETILEPRVRPGVRGAGGAHLDEDQSVRRTEFLPSHDQGRFAYAGVFAWETVVTPFRRARWLEVNSDQMTLSTEPVRIGQNAGGPAVHMAPWQAPAVDALVDGFAATYRFMLVERDRLLDGGSPLTALCGQHVRFVWRPSGTYGAVLQRVLHPRFLQNGAVWSVELDALARPLVGSEEPGSLWPLLREERLALERLDTPRFVAATDGTGPNVRPDLTLEGVFTAPSYALMLRRLSAFDERDLDDQVQVIRASLEWVRHQRPAFDATAREGAPS